jgi:hypothetical protein
MRCFKKGRQVGFVDVHLDVDGVAVLVVVVVAPAVVFKFAVRFRMVVVVVVLVAIVDVVVIAVLVALFIQGEVVVIVLVVVLLIVVVVAVVVAVALVVHIANLPVDFVVFVSALPHSLKTHSQSHLQHAVPCTDEQHHSPDPLNCYRLEVISSFSTRRIRLLQLHEMIQQIDCRTMKQSKTNSNRCLHF